MTTPLSILSFVKARDSRIKGCWEYGYIADMHRGRVSVRYDNGIKPTTESFDLIEAISEETFWSKTKGQTALHSQYHDAKERHVHDPRTELPEPERSLLAFSPNAGAALKAADDLAALVDKLTKRDTISVHPSHSGRLLKTATNRYKAARLKHVAEG